MTPVWKAAGFWFIFPCLFLLVVTVVFGLFDRADFSTIALLSWGVERLVLLPGAVSASIGVLILWHLSPRHALPSALIGMLIAAGLIIGCTIVEMFLWGGFEEDGAILMASLVLLPPSCCAGIYAGLLRSKDAAWNRKVERDKGYWPGSRV